MDLESEILRCENPISWNITEVESDSKIDSSTVTNLVRERLSRRVIDPEFPFYNLILYLVVSYEYFSIKNLDKAIRYIEAGEARFNTLPNSNYKDIFEHKFTAAFMHIWMSMKAYLYLKSGNIPVAAQVMCGVWKQNELYDIDALAGALHGFQAMFFENYPDQIERALCYAREASVEDPDESWWYLMQAKCLRRLRKLQNSASEFETMEGVTLQMAFLRKENAITNLFFADMYREHAALEMDDDMKFMQLQSALEHYRCCSEMTTDANMLLKCATGILAMPSKQRDRELAKSLIERAVAESSRNPKACRALASYYEKVEDTKMAIQCLKAFPNYLELDIIMTKLRLVCPASTKITPKLLAQCKNKSKKYHIQVFASELLVHNILSEDLHEASKYGLYLLKYAKEGILNYEPSCLHENFTGTRDLMDEVLRVIDRGEADYDEADQRQFHRFSDTLAMIYSQSV